MKKLFLLTAIVLLAGNAFGQTKWTDLVVNGNMEGEMPAYESLDMMEEGAPWAAFWTHEFPKGESFEEQYQGTATIVEDPTDPTNHCARVVARSEAVADACENKITPDGQTSLASWDCQFFIYVNEPILSGKEVKMTLRVKAEKAGNFETQAHWAPGDYNHYQLFGNVDVTTEWKRVEVEAVVTTDHTQEGNGKCFQSVAFNLSTNAEGNVFYFDDVKLEVRDPKGPEEFDKWFNFLRHGTLSADKVENFTTFTGRDGKDGRDVQARIVDDPVDGQPALNVTGIFYNAQKITPKTEDGEPVFDENGEQVNDTTQVYVKYGEEKNDTTGIDDWSTQFFVTVPHKFVTGQMYKLVLWGRADKPASVSTQAHVMPGGYKHWDFVGTLDLNEEWQMFEFGTDDSPRTIASEANGCQTIAFNCNIKKDEEVNYYFRFDEFSFNNADVTEKDRILTTEDIKLPVPEVNSELPAIANIDMNKAIELLGIEDFSTLLTEDHMKIMPKEDDEQVDFTESIDETIINSEGYLSKDESENAISFLIDEDQSKNGIAAFNIYNLGAELGNGKFINSNICFENEGWYYVFSANFYSQADYDGIQGIMTKKQASNTIYDLTGRKISKPAKGLYIMNGQKFIQK